MILRVVKFGEPVLRKRGARIEKITAEVRRLISDMLDTMYAHKGVGLAAQQVGVAQQLAVVDVRGVTDRPSWLERNGEHVDVGDSMPLVLINPEIKPGGEPATGPEGCLSFPEIYAEITRPESIDVKATDREGNTIQFRCGGLLARAIQHEVDHLQGILFIDRMEKKTKDELRPELDALQAQTKDELQSQKK
jgi:peptide deformylase